MFSLECSSQVEVLWDVVTKEWQKIPETSYYELLKDWAEALGHKILQFRVEVDVPSGEPQPPRNAFEEVMSSAQS